jgi:hypothetical protein
VRIGFWWGEQGEREHFKDLGVDGNIKLKLIIRELDGVELTGLVWLRIRTGGGRL